MEPLLTAFSPVFLGFPPKTGREIVLKGKSSERHVPKIAKKLSDISINCLTGATLFVMMAAEAFCAKVPSLTECILLVLHKALRAAAAAVPGGAGLWHGVSGPAR